MRRNGSAASGIGPPKSSNPSRSLTLVEPRRWFKQTRLVKRQLNRRDIRRYVSGEAAERNLRVAHSHRPSTHLFRGPFTEHQNSRRLSERDCLIETPGGCPRSPGCQGWGCVISSRSMRVEMVGGPAPRPMVSRESREAPPRSSPMDLLRPRIATITVASPNHPSRAARR